MTDQGDMKISRPPRWATVLFGIAAGIVAAIGAMEAWDRFGLPRFATIAEVKANTVRIDLHDRQILELRCGNKNSDLQAVLLAIAMLVDNGWRIPALHLERRETLTLEVDALRDAIRAVSPLTEIGDIEC